MTSYRPLCASLLWCAALVGACGSGGNEDLFSTGGTSGVAGTGAAGAAGSVSDASASGGTGTTGGAAGSSGEGGASGSGATDATTDDGEAGALGSDGGGAAGQGGALGASGQSGAAGGGASGQGGTAGAAGRGGTSGGIPTKPGSTVPCGNMTCATDTGAVCCLVIQGGGQPTQASCLPAGSPCAFPNTAARCDGPEDCAAPYVCCGRYQVLSGFEIYTRTECAASCSGQGQLVVCDPADSASCPSGSCQRPLTLPTGYEVCR